MRPPEICSLRELPLHAPVQIQCVQAHSVPEWSDGLAELGFLPGESVQVLARGTGFLGASRGEPLVVRVGDSTFALRGAEADCVQVLRTPDEGSAT